MSANNINPSNDSGPSRKRSRKNNHPSNHNDDRKSCYKNVSFHERKSSGRPGSPHRYFERSYVVSFLDSVDGDDGDVSSSFSRTATKSDDDTAAVAEASTLPSTHNNADNSNSQSSMILDNNNSAGNQVVHRHVNGLCIITAGNILQTTLQQQQEQNSTSSKGKSQHCQPILISSIKYLVQIAPDAQSAKGKLRAKNKKRKKKNNNNTTDDSSSQAQDVNCGDVSPNDALCEVNLVNGDKVILKCCVQGTIIELNHRLAATDGAVEKKQQSSNIADVDGRNINNKDGDENSSLVLTDPLLDGYLAVIMPHRGTHLPTL